MKQHITETQLTELSASQFEKLTKYVTEKNLLPHFTGSQLVLHPASKYLADCMNIGQMIEFLMETNLYTQDGHFDDAYENTVVGRGYCVFGIGWDGELGDTLWKVVKEEVEKE